jgi:DNA polymerase epsilon subunit 1
MYTLYYFLLIKNNFADGRSKMMSADSEYTGRCLVHLDAFRWVQRDSYLPQGNQGLKAVTKYKLGYDPIEVDPEDMLKFARFLKTKIIYYRSQIFLSS